MAVKFSVFTPTYNRAHTIHRTWESLKSQDYSDFEWLVYDDGSTDGTKDLVEAWAREARFRVTYVWVPRRQYSGKHVMWNLALKAAKGQYFIVLDSDDGCRSDSLSVLSGVWDYIEGRSDAATIAYVATRCADQNSRAVGTAFPEDGMVSDHLSLHWKYRMTGDRWECYRTQILRQFPMPEPSHPGAVPEGIILSRMALHYKVYCLNVELRTYFNDGPDSSIVRSTDPRRHAWGRLLAESEILWRYPHWYVRAPVEMLAAAIKFMRCVQLLHVSKQNVRSYLPTAQSRVLALLGAIPGRLYGAIETMRRA